MVARAESLMESLLAPINLKHPLLMASFGMKAIQSASGLARRRFSGVRARAMFGGVAAHSLVPLEFAATAGYGFGLLLGAHTVGWPVVRGSSQNAANAMASYLRSLGGEIVTGERVESLAQLPKSRLVLCDVTPRQLLTLAGDRVPAGYRRRLERFRYGPGVFKMDWALNAPVPWRAKDCARAGTLHLGGTLEEIAASEQAPWNSRVSDRPYVLVVQPTMFDASRAPAGKHTLWAYCHVPHGSTVDMSRAIEDQIERFAPGFRDCISSRHAMGPMLMQERNANARPVASLNPYRTAIDGVFLCSSSTPPGVGVHGMCGHWAAKAAMRSTTAARLS